MDHTTQLIIEYRYWILVPLTFIEGPIVAFIAGTLASAGFFDIYILAALFFVRDVGMDGVYYGIGYWGGRTKFARKMLRKIGITPEHLNDVRELWRNHAGKTMFIGKISYGIASAFIVVAGMVKMPLKKFFGWGAVVAVVQYWSLLLVGYFFGAAFGGTIKTILNNVEYALLGGAILIAGYYGFSWYMRGKFLKADEEIEKGR